MESSKGRTHGKMVFQALTARSLRTKTSHTSFSLKTRSVLTLTSHLLVCTALLVVLEPSMSTPGLEFLFLTLTLLVTSLCLLVIGTKPITRLVFHHISYVFSASHLFIQESQCYNLMFPLLLKINAKNKHYIHQINLM